MSLDRLNNNNEVLIHVHIFKYLVTYSNSSLHSSLSTLSSLADLDISNFQGSKKIFVMDKKPRAYGL